MLYGQRLQLFLRAAYRFLPVQLLLLHGRKYQLLLIFWAILFLTVQGSFAEHFGANTLFLAPEYLGQINFLSMMLLGSAMGIFVMSWHITTFIIHSKRMPFIGATRQAFLKYCINNSLLPLSFFIYYSIVCLRFQRYEEAAGWGGAILLQVGFYLGLLLMVLVSFAYFFRVGRDLLKTVLATITNPSHLRGIVPYDALDFEFDMIQADTFLTETLRIEQIEQLEKYHPRLLNAILRRHHRNATAATIFALLLLLLLGIFMDEPLLRIPAGAGFLMLFAVLMGIVGAVKYFLRSWEVFGWLLFVFAMSWLVSHHLFDLRSVAYGLNYQTAQKPAYNYAELKKEFTLQRYEADKNLGIAHLNAWKSRQAEPLPPLVVITVSGGGSRSAYWTFRALQYADSLCGGDLFRRTAIISGASGGMLGAAFWRNLHQQALEGKIQTPYAPKYQAAIGEDLLNAIIFSFVAVDIISPFNRVKLSGYRYTKDRGYAMEQDLLNNTHGILGGSLADFKNDEKSGRIPQLIINGTIANDGRKLIMATMPLSYLTQPVSTLGDTANPTIDAVDFGTLFAKQNAYNLRLITALRINATFPYVLPVVRFPSVPAMNVMDAGLRDNFGAEIASRWMHVFQDWLHQNTREIIWLQIRDTKEYDVLPATTQDHLGAMLSDPLFIIQHKWEPFQSYSQSYLRDYVAAFFGPKLHALTLEYTPQKEDKMAKLNFHLTRQEKDDLRQAVYSNSNQACFDSLKSLIH
ncbi:MAG: patatin-like phospholipase family protein [Bacteroidetes bacterium]|nr:patatin-like phospholipase family protein [Bacteroidota bacterium]